MSPSGAVGRLRCGYNLYRGKKGIAVQFIHLEYFIGEASLGRRDGEPVTFCWRVPTADSTATETSDGGTLTPLQDAIGAPETIILNGREGIIYSIGDRFIKANYGASATRWSASEKKELMNVSRKAAIELAVRLANDPAVGVATCLGEVDPTAKAYLAAVERFLSREAAANEMELDASSVVGPLAAAAAIGGAFRAHAEAAEGFAAQLAALPLPPEVKAEVDALTERVLQEATLWRIIASDAGPTEDPEAHLRAVFAAQDELLDVTAAREAADRELRGLLGLE